MKKERHEGASIFRQDPPICPDCDTTLTRVTYPGGYLNPEQWESVKAGDWLCENPKCVRKYFFSGDVLPLKSLKEMVADGTEKSE